MSFGIAAIFIASLGLVSTVHLEISDNAPLQRLSITPRDPQTKPLGANVMLVCTLSVLSDDVDDIGHLSSPVIRWRGPDMEYISVSQGRVYVERQDAMSLRLYVNQIQSSDAGLYSCESDYFGELQSNETEVFVYDGIRFANTATFVEQNVGKTAVLECVINGQSQPEITWRFGGQRIQIDGSKYSLVKGTSLRISDIQRSDNGTYQCRAEVDSLGDLQVRQVDLNVLYAPVLIETPSIGQVVVMGMRIILRCVAEGNPPVKYDWIKEQKMSDMAKLKVPLSTQDPQVYIIPSMDAASEGRFVCRVSNKLGSKEASVDITMMVPPELHYLPTERRIVEGGNVIVSCNATGVPEPAVQWTRGESRKSLVDGPQPDDSDIRVDKITTTSSRLLIHNVRRSHGGNYSCTGVNDVGTTAKTMYLTIEYKPIIVSRIEDLYEERQFGWRDQQRRFICSAHGLPRPTVTWVRNSQHIFNNEYYKVFTPSLNESSDDFTSTSVLEVSIGHRQHWLFGTYHCIAKNNHGQSKKIFHLLEAEVPEAPGNVTVREQTSTSVTLHIGNYPRTEETAPSSRPPVTTFLIEYELETVYTTDHQRKSTVIQNDGNPILRISNLTADAVYTFHVAAGNKVGFSSKIKFLVKTLNPESATVNEQSDGPARSRSRPTNEDDEAPAGNSDAHENMNVAEAVGMEAGGNRASLFTGVSVGVIAALVIGVVLSAGVVIRLRQRRQQTPDEWFSGIMCCKPECFCSNGNINKAADNSSAVAETNNGACRLDCFKFWKHRPNQSSVNVQQAGPGRFVNEDMGPPTYVATESVPALQSAVSDKHAVINSPSNETIAKNCSPNRPGIRSPILSGYQQQAVRAPGTPPPTIFRSPSAAGSCGGASSHASLQQAWKCLKSTPTSGRRDASAVTITNVLPQLMTANAVDSFTERDWQLKQFLEASKKLAIATDQVSCDSDDERSYHDILDGYHSEDNLDDKEDDDEKNYRVAVGPS